MKTIPSKLITFACITMFTGAILQSCEKIPADAKNVSVPDVKTVSAIEARTMYAEIDGRKIAYRTIGEGEPLILCNRFRGTLDTWDPAFLDALANRYQVVTFDYSGFGLSTGTPATDMTSFAKDVKDLMKALDFQKIIIGGWSFGGMVAQTSIAQFPELISHGILIGTGPPGKNEASLEPIFLETSRILNYNLEHEMILFFEPAWEPSRNAARLSHERIAKRVNDLDVIIPEALWENYTKGYVNYVEDKDGLREKILTSKVPMLVISGDHDISFPVENWYALVRKLQTIQLIVIPMSGHGPQHEYPQLVAQYIKDFLQYLS